ncbi:DUF4376 domain-containing protein [Thalassovita taeanensis]|uniref:DUF4376 domain-containing protein n=1 Tax=Thalassovita taeanensis TaxID=657014 RepID=A0A1H9KXJ4_9RHOB|nr:DUF4376 domain-containing protein [Thalassovita taeanensis]SER03892.1 protein of unknown function [Thalassovita taeanensis]
MPNIDLSQLVTAEDKATTARAAKYADLADLRWQRETGGLDLPDGLSVTTTREAQAQIASTVQNISAGLITEPVAWKLASGWADLTAAQITVIAGAVTDHVRCCFTAERNVAGQLAAQPGSLSGIDLDTIFGTAYAQAAQQWS